MRNWQPFIGDAAGRLLDAGATRIVGIPLAPQFSTLSVQKYVDAARDALAGRAPFDAVHSFHAHPLLVEAFAERVRAAAPAADERVVFTAHALPVRVIESGDTYADEVAETAAAVADAAGVWTYDCAFQSAGRTPEPWIGPDVSALVAQRAAEGIRRFLAVPVGFVCDHTEILFDIDVQASAAAIAAGAALRRTESLNTSPTFIAMLEALVRDAL
jgi:ferrochelatase